MTVNSVKSDSLERFQLFVCKYYVSCKTKAVLKQKPVAVACASLLRVSWVHWVPHSPG